MIITVIAAGGSGLRMGTNTHSPKQYFSVDSFNVLRSSIEAFLGHGGIDGIVVAIRPEDRKLYEDATDGLNLLPPVIGGPTRKGSVFNAIQSLMPMMPTKVLVHDAARPFVSGAIISSVIEGLNNFRVVVPCIPITDTVKRIKDGVVELTLDRAELWKAQTPQGFWYQDLLDAYTKYGNNSFDDEATMMEAAGHKVVSVLGSKDNFKITDLEDKSALEAKVRFASNCSKEIFVVGSGLDIHPFDHDGTGSNDRLFLGGVPIDGHIPTRADSDGDVVLHALVDGILGTIGGNDIGYHFDGCAPQQSSEKFVLHALQLLRQKGGRIVNVDINIVCNSPKIGPVRDAISRNIARILEVNPESVNVKGKSGNGLGFVGRKEGIVAQATVTVAKPDIA